MTTTGTPPTDTVERTPPAKDRSLKPVVFFGSAILILAISIWSIVSPGGAAAVIGAGVGWISSWFGWYYFLTATLIVGFVIYMAASRYGKIKLGPQHSTPDYSLFAWGSMFFAAGIGTDLVFFSVAEPVTQYLHPPEGAGETAEAARQSIVWTLFHYGITGWAMYALMGMGMAYFAFRHRLPLGIRSALYPLIGKRIHGPIGDGVDLAAMLGTIFGVAVSLGIGVVQLAYGVKFMFDLSQGLPTQIALIAIAVLMATVSAVAGVDKGIRRVSELNVVLAIVLMVYVSIFEGPVYVLNGIVMNVGDYISRFPGMTLDTMAYDQPTAWLNSWTLFFWAWWIAWAPFVGMFLARISRGRSIRQFVTATLVVPFMFTLAFLSVFGNAALRLVRGGDTQFAQTAIAAPEEGFFALLEHYPGVGFSAGLVVLVGLMLYVTSADSAALVMANLSSHLRTPTTDAAPWLRIFWASATGLLTLSMLLLGGVTALTNATIIMALPFSFVMFLVMWGLYKAVRKESIRSDAMLSSLPVTISERTIEPRGVSRSWRQRLARVMNYPGRRSARTFVDEVCRPAFEEVAEELRTQGATAEVSEGTDSTDVEYFTLRVPMDPEDTFVYGLWPKEAPTPSFAMRSVTDDTYYRFEVFLADGGQGYDVMGYDKDQLIGDILDQYERHLEFLRLHREISGAALPEPS